MNAITLQAGAVVATLYPDDGGRLGQLSFRGEPMLRGPERGVDDGWSEWGSYPLLPWSNRIPDGEFRFEGRELHVPVNWRDGSAIHGLAADRPWAVDTVTDDTAELSIEIDEDPYTVTGRQRFTVGHGALEQRLEVTNRGDERVPVGLGIHPWFLAGEIRVPAELMWPGEPMPTGPRVAVGADEDLRVARVPPPMDRCYTGLTGQAVEVPGVRLSWDGPITHVVVFSGQPEWVCVEPVTMANDGFQLADEGVADTGVVALDPGESFGVTYRFERAS